MNARTFLFAAAAIAPFALAAHTSIPRLRFAPGEGSSVTKTFESKATLSLDDITVTGTGGQSPSMEMTMSQHQKIVVTDQYAKMRDGAPQKLVRSFDELSGEGSASMTMSVLGETRKHDQNMRAKSELEGKQVVFDWNADDNTWKKSFEPAGDDENEVLKGLQEDMDFRQVLPTTEVKEGDEWDIPLGSLRNLFAPGGNLAMVPENTDATSIKVGLETSSLSNMIGDKLEGTARATLQSIVTIEGIQCARIHLDLDVKSSVDMTDVVKKQTAGQQDAANFEYEKVTSEFGFEGNGELVWDLSVGHFRSLDVSGQMSVRNEQSTKVDLGGKSVSIDQKMSFSGRTSYTAKAR